MRSREKVEDEGQNVDVVGPEGESPILAEDNVPYRGIAVEAQPCSRRRGTRNRKNCTNEAEGTEKIV